MDNYQATFNKYEVIIANSFDRIKEFEEKYKENFW